MRSASCIVALLGLVLLPVHGTLGGEPLRPCPLPL